MTLNKLCGSIAEIMDVDCRPNYMATRPGDIKHSFAGINRAEEDLGYQPTVSVSDGLKKTVAWYQAQKATV